MSIFQFAISAFIGFGGKNLRKKGREIGGKKAIGKGEEQRRPGGRLTEKGTRGKRDGKCFIKNLSVDLEVDLFRAPKRSIILTKYKIFSARGLSPPPAASLRGLQKPEKYNRF